VTEPTEGRDESPSVAALAIHVSSVRRDVEELATKVGVLVAKQREHTAVLHDLTDLRQQVEQILSTLTPDEDSPTTWFWLTMSDQERSEKLGELHDWVETVLRAQYPDYIADHIKPCWPNHPEARWELAWLYHLWSSAYLIDRPAPKEAADWHDRWLPGATRRLSQNMSRCEEARCRRQQQVGTADDFCVHRRGPT
jgi:hypothetical protein